jgi:hypothetical protein
MTILLPALAVAFAAFCVWLVVRIVNRRERWAKWTAVAILVAVLIGYPLSSGPARSLLMRIVHRGPGTGVTPNGSTFSYQSQTIIEYGAWRAIYAPIDWAASQKFGTPIRWYIALFPIPDDS